MPEQPHPTPGAYIRQLREEFGIPQRQLALRSGLDPTSLNRTERDKQGPPRFSTITRILGGLGIELTDQRAQRLFEVCGIISPTERPNITTTVFDAKLHETRGKIFDALKSLGELETMWSEYKKDITG